jgi:dual-specificity kinase
VKKVELADSQMRHSDTAHEVDSYYAAYHDHEGHYKYVLGEAIGELLSSSKEPQRRRYKLLEKVGQGTFGRVFKCWDRVKQMIVAVKVVRAVKKYTDSAHVEIDILSKIQNHSRDDTTATQYCIKLLSWFSFKGHMCLVFPYCGLSLYDFLKKNDFRPFEMHVIRDIAYDLFLSLHFMHGRMNLIHTDLKPENVLFKYSEVVYKDNPDYLVGDARMSEVSPETSSRSRSRSSSTSRLHSDDRSTTTFRAPVSSKIRVIDLGSAIFDDEHHSSVISTRHYRAPEVILRLGWRYPADIWSIGCILLELYTGDTTFQTHHNTEHLAMMETILGPFPKNMLFYQDDDSNTLESKNSTVEKYFRQNDQQFCVDYPQKSTSSRSKRRVSELQKLEELIDIENHPDFYDLIKKTLLYEPEKRITAREALEHSFFTSYQTPCTTTNSS